MKPLASFLILLTLCTVLFSNRVSPPSKLKPKVESRFGTTCKRLNSVLSLCGAEMRDSFLNEELFHTEFERKSHGWTPASRLPRCRLQKVSSVTHLLIDYNSSDVNATVARTSIRFKNACVKHVVLALDTQLNKTRTTYDSKDMTLVDEELTNLWRERGLKNMILALHSVLESGSNGELEEIPKDSEVAYESTLRICRKRRHKCNPWRKCCNGLKCKGFIHGRCRPAKPGKSKGKRYPHRYRHEDAE